jgi:hypothetical protein
MANGAVIAAVAVLGVGAVLVGMNLARASGPRWPLGADLGFGITIVGVAQTPQGQWLYTIEYSEGIREGPYTEDQILYMLSLYQ